MLSKKRKGKVQKVEKDKELLKKKKKRKNKMMEKESGKGISRVERIRESERIIEGENDK